MKKVILSFVILLVAVSLSAQMPQVISVIRGEEAYKPNSEFFEIYNKAVELNQEAYPDFHKIPINAPVAFPDYDNDGVVYFPARVPENGKHDCIWYLSLNYQQLKAHYQDSIKRSRAEIRSVPAPVITPSTPEKNTGWGFWEWFILILAAVIVIVLHSLNRLRPWNNRRDINRNPVVAGGLSNDPVIAADQINRIHQSQSPAVSVTRGVLLSEDGSSARVIMQFSDGRRTVTLNSGETVYQVIRQNGDVDYYRQHCGNLVGEVSNGRLTIPEGWRFEALATSATAPINTATITQTTEAKPEEEKKAFDLEGLAKVLEAAGNMKNVPSKITYGELIVEFQPVTEKAEDK